MLKQFFATPTGQAVAAFARVFAATLLGCWLQAGTPVHGLTSEQLFGWLELALQAAVALVITNYFGPWEKRYGNKSVVSNNE